MLGEGGLGTVYKAYDTRLKRMVAVKTLKRSVYSDDPDMYRSMEERFQREAEAGSRMHVHPNLVVVHDFVTDTDKSLYLIQEFVPRGTLADRIAREGALPQSDALRLAADVAPGLSAAHEVHIVHRDIKPANIFLSADGRARVGDFGIAQPDDLSGRTRATSGHPGTPLYMSPEQAGSSGYVRAESDQYSLGLVLFEMLTGQTYKRLRKRQAEELLSKKPEQIQSLVRKMIADDPDDRFESVNDVATEIARIERQLASAATSLPQSVSNETVIAQDLPTLAPVQDATTRVQPKDYRSSRGIPSVKAKATAPKEASLAATEQETRRETPRVNLQPMAPASLRPPPTIPVSKPISRRNVIIGGGALAVAGVTGGVFALSRGQGGAVATATSVVAETPIPVATSVPIVAATPVPPVDGVPVGGDGAGCFSFYPTKNVTSGEGGMVTTNDPAVADAVRLFRSHGMRRRYYHEVFGLNYRMTDLLAAIGLAQMKHLQTWNAIRASHARRLTSGLYDSGLTLPAVRPGYTHVFHQYTVRVREDRDGFRERLKDEEIGSEVYYPVPVHQQQVYAGSDYARFPEAERAAREVLSLPVHPSLTDREIDRVIVGVGNALRR